MSEQSPKPKPMSEPAAGSRVGASSADDAKRAYKYLPIECPNCGYQGKVKIQRLDQTFHCKECNQVFHVTRDGTVAGERPPEAPSVSADAPPTEEKPSWVEAKFTALPPAAKWAALGAGLLGLVIVVVMMMEPQQPLPGDLDDRALLAGKAFAKGDWKMFKRLAKPKTSSALGKWFDKSRPEAWQDLDVESKIDVTLGKEEKILRGYEKTKPILDARTPVEIHPVDVTGPEGTLKVSFFWSQDEKGDWWLDGERMLSDSKPVEAPAAKKGQEDEAAEESDEAAKQTEE